MLARRTDLPLDRDDLSRFLPWVIAFMVFLAALALAGALALSAMVGRWDQGMTGTLTIQVPAADSPEATRTRLDALLAVLDGVEGIDHVRVIDDRHLARLLEPWLGSADALGDLPLPRLIDVELRDGAALDVESLAQRLGQRVAGVTIDDHRIWLDRLISLIRTTQAVALAVLGLTGLATVGTVVFATRAGLAIHQEVIEVLHLIGAQDGYIAGQFAWRAMVLGLRGGVIGLLLAGPTLLGVGYAAGRLQTDLIPPLALGVADWAALALLPLAVAAIAMLTARHTVLKTLKRMQ